MTKRQRRKGGRASSSSELLATTSGAESTVDAQSEKVEIMEPNEEVDGEKPMMYSIDEFGRILQTSQWSLACRIEVCKVLDWASRYKLSKMQMGRTSLSGYHLQAKMMMMTPLSRQEYAKQSLALVDRPHRINVNDISVSGWPSMEEMSTSVKRKLNPTSARATERSLWQEQLTKVRNNMMEHVFGDWKELRILLEEELESLREKDKLEEWYNRAFEGKDLQPWQIYDAVEKGHVDRVHEMMADIGVEHWGKLKPREYRGATPLHWAALHNLVDKTLWDLIDSDPWPEELFDDFGFKPVHMAIFASSFLSGSKDSPGGMDRCLDMIDGYAAILTGDLELDPRDGEKLFDDVTWELPRKKRTHGWNFEVCPLTRSTRDGEWIDISGPKDKSTDSANSYRIQSGCESNEKFFVFKLIEEMDSWLSFSGEVEYIFVARCYFNTPIHPLHLAIWIGHPTVVEKLMHSLKGKRHLFLETDDGDTILHLAFKAMDFERKFTNAEVPNPGDFCTPNFEDRIWSPDYYYKGMAYDSRERVMTIMMRYLYSYPQLLNSQNKDGQTPLHIAIFQGNLSCVRALLRCDYANYNIRNKKEVTPIDMVLKLDTKHAIAQRMYANILGRKCSLSEEVGITTIMCNDVWYFDYHGRIIDHLEELDSDIVRQRRILQLSQWSYKHTIYALQMLDENSAGLESVKDTFLKQCHKKLAEHSAEQWAKIVVEQSGGNANELQRLKYTFIKETSRQYGSKYGDTKACQLEYEQTIFAAIEGGDWSQFQSRSVTREILLTGNLSYKEANPLHWAVLHGGSRILSRISEKLAGIKAHPESRIQPTTRTKIVDVTDGFGFKCLQFASIYSFIHLDERYKPILYSDKRFTFKDSEQDESDPIPQENPARYEKIIDTLSKMGLWRGLNPGLWSDDCGDFVVWGITSTGVLQVDNYLTQSLLSPLHLAIARPHGFEILLKETPKEAWSESNLETGDTMLHNAERWEVLTRHWSKDEWRKIEFPLLKKLFDLKEVNSRNWNRETPLHRAVRTKSPKWVEVLLQLEHLKFNLRDQEMRTPGDCAAEMLQETPSDSEVKKIVELLDCYDPLSWPRKSESDEKKRKDDQLKAEKQFVEERTKERDEEKKRREVKLEAEKRDEQKRLKEREDQLELEKKIEEERKKTEALQKERQVYVDAGNAILVGGALIASASFGAWLQPPLGLQPYYSPEFLDTSTPPAVAPTYDSYVAIQQHWIIQMFWIFNSLSFFFSLATVIAGADAALPSEIDALEVQMALDSVKRAVKLEAWLLIASILSVIATFATVGFVVLPPIPKYRVNMICTLVIGVVLCLLILFKLLRKLFSRQDTSHAPRQSSTDLAPI